MTNKNHASFFGHSTALRPTNQNDQGSRQDHTGGLSGVPSSQMIPSGMSGRLSNPNSSEEQNRSISTPPGLGEPKKDPFEPVLSQEWTCSLRILGKTTSITWKHSTKSLKSCMKPMSLNQFERPYLSNTPFMSTSSHQSIREPNSEGDMPEGRLNETFLGTRTMMLQGFLKSQEEQAPALLARLSNSYEKSEETYFTNGEDEACQAPLV